MILLSDTIVNFKTVASIAHHDVLIKKFDDITTRRAHKEIRDTRCEALQFGFSEFMKNFAFAIIYITQAVLLYIWPDYKYLQPDNMFTAMFSLMFGVFAFMQAKGNVIHVDTAFESARKVLHVMETPSKIDILHEQEKEKKAIMQGSLKGKIEFRDVWFRYPTRPEQWIFKGLNLTINTDEIVAVVGESGAGKSTFINLIMRFYEPEMGQVLIDDVDVRDYKIADLRMQMGLVMQEPTLFDYTITDNILYGNGQASNQDIYNAAQIANALEFIESRELSDAFDDKPSSLLEAIRSDTYKAGVIEALGEEDYKKCIETLDNIAKSQS